MSVSMNISLADKATPELRAVMARLSQAKISELAGREGVNCLQAHFIGLDTSRANRMGGARSHFYSAAAQATHHRPTADGAELVVSQEGLALRLHGGTVKPSGRTSPVTGKPITSLAIPARAEAYGRTPGDFGKDGLVPVFRRRGGVIKAVALAQANNSQRQLTRGPRKGQWVRADSASATGGQGVILFWLVAQSVHRPDPTVLPSSDQILQSITARLAQHIARREAT